MAFQNAQLTPELLQYLQTMAMQPGFDPSKLYASINPAASTNGLNNAPSWYSQYASNPYGSSGAISGNAPWSSLQLQYGQTYQDPLGGTFTPTAPDQSVTDYFNSHPNASGQVANFGPGLSIDYLKQVYPGQYNTPRADVWGSDPYAITSGFEGNATGEYGWNPIAQTPDNIFQVGQYFGQGAGNLGDKGNAYVQAMLDNFGSKVSYDPTWGLVAPDQNTANQIQMMASKLHDGAFGTGSVQGLGGYLKDGLWAPLSVITAGLGAMYGGGLGAAEGVGSAGGDFAGFGGAGLDLPSISTQLTNFYPELGSLGELTQPAIGAIQSGTGLLSPTAWQAGGIGSFLSGATDYLGAQNLLTGTDAWLPQMADQSWWDKLKNLYNSPEVQTGKTVLQGAQQGLSLAQQNGLLGSNQTPAAGAMASGGGGIRVGGQGQSFGQLSPYSQSPWAPYRGLLGLGYGAT